MAVKKVFLSILMMTNFLAFAGWDETGRSNDGVAYVDVSSIRKNGSVVRISTMMDFYQPTNVKGGKSYSSVISLMEYDCQKVQKSLAILTAYSNKMASGQVVFSHNYSTNWKSFSNDGSDIIFYKIACGLMVKK